MIIMAADPVMAPTTLPATSLYSNECVSGEYMRHAAHPKLESWKYSLSWLSSSNYFVRKKSEEIAIDKGEPCRFANSLCQIDPYNP